MFIRSLIEPLRVALTYVQVIRWRLKATHSDRSVVARRFTNMVPSLRPRCILPDTGNCWGISGSLPVLGVLVGIAFSFGFWFHSWPWIKGQGWSERKLRWRSPWRCIRLPLGADTLHPDEYSLSSHLPSYPSLGSLVSSCSPRGSENSAKTFTVDFCGRTVNLI